MREVGLGGFGVPPMTGYRYLIVTALASMCVATAVLAWAEGSYTEERDRLAREIVAKVRATAEESGRARLSDGVLHAMATVPRHRFVPPSLIEAAYLDRPLPIGMGQTISQPFIVALMTDLLEPTPGGKALEVGTGSGYHAAVLAECFAHVYTIEIVPSLGEKARRLLAELGYRNIDVRIGDGYRGWPEAAPFDAILVTAAPDHVPQPLVDQLAPGGRVVIPVGPRDGAQELLVITKARDGRTVTRKTLAVRFVPLTR
jgi:protein-L-isoaspartate(D-aspartate) O-methyltransferase